MDKKQAPVLIEAVIDRSGSMGHLAQDAIGGYNTWLDTQKHVPGEALLTLTLFDHEFITSESKDIRQCLPLDGTTYVPRGQTALNDAIGRALGRLNAANPEKAILVILTDGHENASREFNTAKIKEMVQAAQARGWQVQYLSADINAFDHAAQYGVNTANTVQFTNDAVGLRAAYTATATMSTDYRQGTATQNELAGE